MSEKAFILAESARVETRIGVLITAQNYAELERVFGESPALAHVQLDLHEPFDEYVRIVVAGKTVLSIRPYHEEMR